MTIPLLGDKFKYMKNKLNVMTGSVQNTTHKRVAHVAHANT